MARKKEAKKSGALTPSKPVPSVPTWVHEMDRWFEDFWHRRRWPTLFGPERWAHFPMLRMETPSVDVYEKDNQIVVTAEIPGMSKKDVEVDLTDSTLTIRGTKKKEEEIKDKGYYHSERSYGAFARTISLPAEVKAEGAKASFKEGVLEVRLPKTATPKQKPLKVAVQ